MRGIITMLVMAALFVIALLVGVPLLDGILPIATEMAPGYTGQITRIHVAVVKWTVVVFLGTIMLWAIFWILRSERQQVR